MTSSQLATVQQIYDNNPSTAIYARSILMLTKGLQYDRYPYDLQTVRSMGANSEESTFQMSIETGMKIYPNPSTEYTMVEIYLKNNVSAELIVYNLLGAESQKQKVSNMDVITIDTKTFSNGIYLFVLKTENGMVEKKKVIISK